MLALINGKVITPFQIIEDGVLLIDGDKITKVGSKKSVKVPKKGKVLDVEGAYISPGFIDTHIHGQDGHNVMDGPSAVRQIARNLPSRGVTSFLPTTISGELKEVERALLGIEEVAKEDTRGAKVLGAHMEGPYFNPNQAGAQNNIYLKKPEPAEYLPILDKISSLKRVSAAPELPGGLELAQELKKRGIIAAIAHSDAIYQEVLQAIEAGYTHATHMFSCMSSFRRIDAYRVAGLIESVLLLDELTTELIADGHHLPPSLMKLVVKIKGVNRICVVTDALSPAGQGSGTYSLGGIDILVEDDVPQSFEVPTQKGNYVAKLMDRSAFAGSVGTMDQMVRNMIHMAGLSTIDAIKTATVNPARMHGVKDRGILTPGMKADITVLNQDIVPQTTIAEGQVVYTKRGGLLSSEYSNL